MKDEHEEAFGPDALEPMDLAAMDAAAAPAGFADRVLAQVSKERAGPPPAPFARRPRRALVASAFALSAAAAVLVLWRAGAPASSGAIAAKDRTEASLGDRARVVLEPGAEVTWRGDEVEQPRGDVFYRVEPGARFRVHTPAGDVEVRGTCFTVRVLRSEDDMQKRDVKVGTVGAALGALAFVAVYEGRVAVSHAKESTELHAGESAKLGDGHVVRTTAASLEAGQGASAAGAADEPLAQANRSLAEQVSEVRRRLEGVATQKADLETRLAEAEKKLAASGDGAPPRTRSEFELDEADWTEMARRGEVKYRVPCMQREAYTPSPSTLDKLGLAPTDAPVIREAYERSYQRLWTELRPMCQAALGASPEIVEKVGPQTCVHLIYDQAAKVDPDAAAEAHTAAAEIRAKLRPEPGPNEKVHPVTKLFLLMSGAMSGFEGDLAKSFGPEDAHRLAYGDGLCKSDNRWGGGKKRGPAGN